MRDWWLALASGVLLSLSFPKFGHASVAWLSLAPLFVALAGATPRRGALLGYVAGASSGVGLLYWTAFVVSEHGGQSLPVGFAVMLLLAAAWAVVTAGFGGLASLWVRAFGVRAVLLMPVIWVATELLRTRTYFRFPWCLLGYSQYAHPSHVQLASVFGVYGVSFVIAMVSALVAYALLEPLPARKKGAALAAVGLVLGSWLYGSWVLARPLPPGATLRVALVQPSIRQEDKWRPELLRANLERHFELTEAQASEARLVVWPESAVPYLLEVNPALAGRLRALTRQHDQYLLFGNDDRDLSEQGEDRAYVGAKLLTPGGDIGARYRKIQLVPFGEFVPLKALFTLGGRISAQVVARVGGFTPGTEHTIGDVDGVGTGPLICYEVIFPNLVRGFVTEGAELLVNMTNDAWYGTSSAPYQHFSATVLRAVESGRYVVRAANTGISAIVDPRGRVLAKTRLFEPAVLVEDVRAMSHLTPYARYGDVFAWSCVVATLLLTALAWRARKSRRDAVAT